MDLNSYLLFSLLPLCLAVLLSLLLVRGESCGAMTTADPGDDLASLMAKTIAKFKTQCRGKRKQTGKLALYFEIKVYLEDIMVRTELGL